MRIASSAACLLCAVSTFVSACFASRQIEAAPQESRNRNLAITDLAEVDTDFHLQGEYLGWVGSRYCGRRSVGLQVVAEGGGKFSAVEYLGGLPGSGWHGGEKQRLAGSLHDGALRLANSQRQITIRAGRGTIRNASGSEIGGLSKVRRSSRTLGAHAPPGAIVLFDGSTDEPENLRDARLTADGLLMTGTTTTMPVGDFLLHLEFRTPYMPYARGQGRGNSGVYIQRRYEVQILDSFGLEGEANECGGIYRQHKPDLNMCFPPLSWQSYDIEFRAARWNSSGQKVANASITVRQNGVLVHHHRDLLTKTGAGQREGPELLPIHLQHHGNPVHFRNVWIVLTDRSTAQRELRCAPRRRLFRLGLFARRCR